MKFWVALIIICILIMGTIITVVVVSNKTNNKINKEQHVKTKTVYKTSPWVYLLILIVILLVIAVVLLLTRKPKPIRMFETVSLEKVKNILKKQFCKENNIPAVIDDEGNVVLPNNDVVFKSQRAFYTSIGTKHVILEAEINNGYESGLYVYRVPVSAGEAEIENEFYDKFYHESIFNYMDYIFSPRRFPIFSYKEAEEKLLQVMMTLDPEAITQIRTKMGSQVLPRTISPYSTAGIPSSDMSELHLEDVEGVSGMSPRELYEYEKWRERERRRLKRLKEKYRRRRY